MVVQEICARRPVILCHASETPPAECDMSSYFGNWTKNAMIRVDYEGHRFDFVRDRVFITTHWGVKWELKLLHDPDNPFTILCMEKNVRPPREDEISE